MRVAVIGGGPSGLVTLKYLKTAHHFFPIQPIEVVLFESASQVGGVFFHHSYEEGEMVSSKYLTTFSDFRPKESDPDFYTSEQYVRYLTDFATHFDLWPNIKLSTGVKAVRRGYKGRGHVVVYKPEDAEETEFECDAIAVCSGLHDKPSYANIPGMEHVPESWHSEHFKGRAQLEGKKTVMVLGSGETAADICYLGMTTPSVDKVVLCHRKGWAGVPKAMPKTILFPALRGYKQEDFNGMDPFDDNPTPLDISQSTLFDTMYVHPMVRDGFHVWHHHKLVAIDAAWAAAGAPKGYDMYVGALPDEIRHPSKIFFMKAWNRIQPFTAPPYRPTNPSLLERFRRTIVGTPWADAGRYLDVAPFPSYFDSDGVAHFHDNGRPEYQRIKDQVIKPDLVIYATGYTQTFPFLSHDNQSSGEKPYPTASEADVRNIWKKDDPTVGFMGFVRPGLGAIPALSEFQAMLWTMNILGRIDPSSLDPEDEPHYRILTPPGSRVKYGVDHESYAWQLGLDMGCAPGVKDVVKLGWNGPPKAWYRLPIVWAGSNHFGAKFRMIGPWQCEGAVDTMVNEMWGTITRRKGMFGNFTLAVLPVVFLGTASLLAWLWCTFWAILAFFHLARPVKHVNHIKKLWEKNLRIEEEMKKSGSDCSNGSKMMKVKVGNGAMPLKETGDGVGGGGKMMKGVGGNGTMPLKTNGDGVGGYGTV